MAETISERIVVQTTAQEKRAIAAKAKELGISTAELMRRGATNYQSDELGQLADKAQAAVDRASKSIDSMLSFVEASNIRIAAMEAGHVAPERNIS